MRIHSTTSAVFLLLLVSSVFSWGEVGHLLVTQITEYDLKARGQDAVFQKANDIVLRAKEMSPQMTWTFEGASIYADELKFVQKIDVFDEMHYADMIFNPNGLSLREAAPQPNALDFINKTRTAYKGKTGNLTWTDTFLLRMFLHIVGDMHQPLHMTTLFNEQFPTGDRGGNSFKIKYQNKSEEEAERLGLPNNLHSYWDQGAGLFPSFPKRPLPKENQTWIQDYAKNMTANFTRDDFKQELLEKNVTIWGKACFNISRDIIYPPLLNNGHIITPNYTSTMYQIMLRQIALAGYRLSDLLVEMFGNKHNTIDHHVQRVSYVKNHGFLAKKIRESHKIKKSAQ